MENTSYSEEVSCKKAATVSKEHPHEDLKANYCKKLIIRLMNLMCEENVKCEDQTINFCGYTIWPGAIVINCVDEGSKDWQ